MVPRPVACLLLSILLLTPEARGEGRSESDCNALFARWSAAHRKVLVLDLEIQGKLRPGEERKYSDTVADLKQVLDDTDIGKAKEKVDKLREKFANPRFKDFLERTSKGLEKVDGYKGKAADLLDKTGKVMKLLETDTSDPVASLKSFAEYVEVVNGLTESMTKKIPGMGDFMNFYVKALSASANAIESIAKKRTAALVRAGGKEFHPKYDQLVKLEREAREIRRQIERDCGEYFTWFRGEVRGVAAVRIILAEEEAARRLARQKAEALARLRKRRSEAQKKEEERLGKIRAECAAKVRKMEMLRRSVAALSRSIQELGERADPLQPAHVNEGYRRRAAKLREELVNRRNQVDRLRSLVWAECSDDNPDLVKRADSEEKQSWAVPSGYGVLRRFAVAKELGDEIREHQTCEKGCEKCIEELEALRQEVEKLPGRLQGLRDRVAPARQAIRDAKTNYDAVYQRSKTYAYEDSQGNLVLSATKTAPGLSYKGYGIFPPNTRKVAAAKKQIGDAEKALADLEGSIRDAEKELRRKRAELAQKQEDCEACRRACKKSRDAFLGQYRDYLEVFGHPEKRGEEKRRAAVERAAAVDRSVETGLSRADAVLRGERLRTLGNSESSGNSGEQGGTPAPDPVPSSGPGPASGPTPAPGPDPVPARSPTASSRAPGGTTLVGSQGEDGGRSVVRFDLERLARAPSSGRVDRTRDGTEGLLGDQGESFLAGWSLPGGQAPRRTPGTSASGGQPAGEGSGGPVQVSSSTRWEAAKRVLRRFLSAYVARDLGGVLRCLSQSFVQDLTVLRNALMEDFQRETDINLDLELLNYRFTRDSVQVEVRWSRSATDQQSGAAAVRTGTSRILLSREGGFGISGWFGATPFGLSDAAWNRQAAAGDVNRDQQSSTASTAEDSPSAYPGSGGGSGEDSGGGPVGVPGSGGAASPVTILDESTGAGPNHYFLNLTSGVAGGFTGVLGSSPGTCNVLSNCSQPGMDVLLHFDQRFGGNITIMEGQISGGSQNRQVFSCGPSDVLSYYGSLGGFGRSSFQKPLAGPRQFVVGVARPGGVASLVRFDVSGAVGGPYQVTASWVNGSSSGGVGTGMAPCTVDP